MRHSRSLRGTLAAIVAVKLLMMVVVSAALIAMTTFQHRESQLLEAAVEKVRLVEEAELDLLLHTRARDPLLLAELEGELNRKLMEARTFVSSERESELLRAAESTLARYLAVRRSPGRTGDELEASINAAYVALEDATNAFVQQARATRAQIDRWDSVANIVGIGAISIFVALVIAVLRWIRRALEPVLSLGRAMERFGDGERDARAPEYGPTELRDMARRFNEMATVLGRQHETLLTFLASLAHDLRNPLSALRMSLASVAPGRPLPAEERVRRTYATAQRQVERLDRIIGDFLDVARFEAGQLELRLEPRDLREIATHVVELFQESAPGRDFRLILPAQEVRARCDADRIEQVLNNLVSNAVKYSPEGGPVLVAVAERRNEAVLSVTDRGIGISLDERRLIFEPFQRAHAAGLSVPGLGLGLSFSRRIVEAHGGRLEVESKVGEGSTFTICLPAHQPADLGDGEAALPPELHH